MGTSLIVVYNNSFTDTSGTAYHTDAAATGPLMDKPRKAQPKPGRAQSSILQGYTGVIDQKVSSILDYKNATSVEMCQDISNMYGQPMLSTNSGCFLCHLFKMLCRYFEILSRYSAKPTVYIPKYRQQHYH